MPHTMAEVLARAPRPPTQHGRLRRKAVHATPEGMPTSGGVTHF